MSEKELERQFVHFLVREKGFPQGSILSEAVLEASIGISRRRYIADLILLDTDFNNYLALVEFKANLRIPPNDSLRQVKTYLLALGKPNLPAYIILGNANDNANFEIFLLEDDTWRKIDIEDFPRYESLRSKNQADFKKALEDIEEAKEKHVKKKEELVRSTAFSSLISLAIAIITVLITSLTLFKDSGIIFKEGTLFNSIEPGICCDSLSVTDDRISKKVNEIERKIQVLYKKDSVLGDYDRDIKLKDINSRLKAIEANLDQSPERLLKVQELAYEIKSLQQLLDKEKELSDVKILNLKERIDQLTLWTSGLIITIIGSIIGFAVNAFRKG